MFSNHSKYLILEALVLKLFNFVGKRIINFIDTGFFLFKKSLVLN